MPDARDLAADMLHALDPRRARVREVLADLRPSLGDPRDRALLTELAYGVLRRQLTLDAILTRASRRKLDALAEAARTALRLGLYQVIFLDRVPPHAAVDHAVGWARAQAGAKVAGYVNGVLRALVRACSGRSVAPEDPRCDVPLDGGGRVRFGRPVFADPRGDAARNLGQRYGVPRWLVQRWRKAFGAERTLDVLRAAIGRPPLVLRARGPRDGLLAALQAEGIEASAGAGPQALVLPPGTGIEPLVASGRAWVQDATSQRVVPLLDPAPGTRVLDLCAAPGGKSVQIADALAGRGELVLCDVDPAKVEALAALAPQLGGLSGRALAVPAEGPLPFPEASFDRILVDAPCSNTGVLRRRVELRARLRPSDPQQLAAVQLGLLERAWPLLAPGGRLVYSTCSLEAEENEGVVEAFAAGREGLRVQEGFLTFPAPSSDGGFAAVLERTP